MLEQMLGRLNDFLVDFLIHVEKEYFIEKRWTEYNLTIVTEKSDLAVRKGQGQRVKLRIRITIELTKPLNSDPGLRLLVSDIIDGNFYGGVPLVHGDIYGEPDLGQWLSTLTLEVPLETPSLRLQLVTDPQ